MAGNTIPEPPKLENVVDPNLPALAQWFSALYKALVLDGQFVTAADQVVDEAFDPSTLPSPNTSNIATAQATANEAYTIATAARSLARALQDVAETFGTVTISGTNTTGAVTLAEAQDDTDYEVVVSAKSFTGTPAVASFVIAGITSKTTAGFAVNCATAPGTGNTITYTWFLRRAL